MPELPEVETVVLSLRPAVVNKVIIDMSSYPGHERVFEHLDRSLFKKKLLDKKIIRVNRRGKYILLQLEGGVIAIHLRMTGILKTSLGKNDNPNHLAAKIKFEDGSFLYFKDYRKFGRFYFFSKVKDMDSFLGVEPLSDVFSINYLKKGLMNRRRMIKPFLLDQKFIAGLGNIYVDEALWFSKIHPETVSSIIPASKVYVLHSAIKDVLKKALSFKGTTFMSFSFEGDNSGSFKDFLNVFGRAGLPCNRCGNKIVKLRVGQRGTHICPVCQKTP